jgi:predicted Zn-ribbon and HTH transcriptional regulator
MRFAITTTSIKDLFWVIKIAKMIHTVDEGEMIKFHDGLRCNKCGYTLKRKEVHDAYQRGKIDNPVSQSENQEMKIRQGT